MRFMSGIVMGALLFLPCSLWAQRYHGQAAQPEMDLAMTYSAQRADLTTGSNFWPQGGSAELTSTFFHGLGVAADVTGTHSENISPSGTGLTLVTATFGPTYTWAQPHHGKSSWQWKFFGESLVGIANGVNSVFPNPNGPQTSANGLALQVGGGADLDLSRHFAVRLLQADWLRTQLPNATTNVQNSLQLSAGIVFRLR